MKLAALIFATLFPLSSLFSQERFPSVEATFSLPTGEFAEGFGYGIGGNASYSHQIMERYTAVFQFGIHYFQTKEDGIFRDEPGDFYYQIPIEIGIRYFAFDVRRGPYAGLLTGMNFQDVFIGNRSEPTDEKDGYFSLTPELGWYFSRKLSVSLRYRFTFIPERFEEENFVVEGPDGNNILETREVKRDEEILSYLSLGLGFHF
jgi:hypothetical protein